MNNLRFLLFCLLPLASFAQSPVSTRIRSGVDIEAGFRQDQISPSLSYYQLLNIGERKRFAIGWTTSFRTFYASNVTYTTAPAYISRGGKSGIYALGAPLVPQNLDTLRMASASGTSLNFGIRAQFHLKFIEIGASADLLGITIGKNRIGQYVSSTGYFAGKSVAGADSIIRFTGSNVAQTAKPTIANVQLLGDNTIGTIATEVYAKVLLAQRFGVKVGYQWLTTEYTASVKNVVDNNNRFRSHSGLTYVGITIPFFQ
ncbi:hypothetical protein [Fibrella arboris]|uniref:hypothetical protein n=1 Tax=Fibrella arboris TaxID=3242486 RepID=UPI003522E38E